MRYLIRLVRLMPALISRSKTILQPYDSTIRRFGRTITKNHVKYLQPQAINPARVSIPSFSFNRCL
jgi:hypothetical protein